MAGGLEDAFAARGVPVSINRVESMFSVFFTDEPGAPVRNFPEARAADHDRYGRFFHHCLERHVYLPPSGYELWTLSAAHGSASIALAIEAASAFAG